MPIENFRHPALDAMVVGLGAVTEIHEQFDVAGDDIGRARATPDVGDLEARRRKEFVAFIPDDAVEFG